METALAAQVAVLPVLVGGTTLPEEVDLPESLRPLRSRHAIAVPDGAVETVLIPRFEVTFRPHTVDSVHPPPRRSRLWRRLIVAGLVLAVLTPLLIGGATELTRSIGVPRSIAVAPDGVRVAAILNDGWWAAAALRVWNSVSGEPEAVHRYGPEEVRSVSLVWSPDGRSLAVFDYQAVVTIRATDTLAVQRTLLGYQGTPGYFAHLAWSPDGAMLAAADETGTLRLLAGCAGAHTTLEQSPVQGSGLERARLDGGRPVDHARRRRQRGPRMEGRSAGGDPGVGAVAVAGTVRLTGG